MVTEQTPDNQPDNGSRDEFEHLTRQGIPNMVARSRAGIEVVRHEVAPPTSGQKGKPPYLKKSSLVSRNRNQDGGPDLRVAPTHRGKFIGVGDSEGPVATRAVHQKPGPSDWPPPAVYRRNGNPEENGPETDTGQQTFPIPLAE